MSITLNDKQREAVDFMHKFMEGPDRMMVLEGFAGTGKTTCVQTFAEETDHRIAFTAPTNKATKVLRQMAETHIKRNVDARTIYSLLGLILTADGEYKQVDALGENEACNYDVLVVDESSMVGRNLFRHIQDSIKDIAVKIIFMGDPAQLPPVKEEYSPVFELANKITLSKVMRHDNQILTLATNIRRCIYDGGKPEFLVGNDANGGVFIANGSKFRDQMEKGYASETYKTTRDMFKTVAWRNITVNGHNDFIRATLYGAKVGPEFQVGERIVACAPVMDLLAKLRGEKIFGLHTDEEATVVSLEITEHPIYREIMCDKVILKGDHAEDTSLITAYCVHESSKNAHKVLLERLANRAKLREGSWSSFWDAKDSFHDLRPCHAITAHRSQGSTYQTVFVNAADILCNRNREEALKCLYVAVTRASKIVVLRLQ